MKAIIAAGAVALAVSAQSALASDYDNMSVEEIKAQPGFVQDTLSLSGTTNSGEPDADHIYWWIGYIADGDKRIYFTSYGEALTCVQWERTGEWVPEWVAANLERLTADGYIVLEQQ